MHITTRDAAMLLIGLLAGVALLGWYGYVRLGELARVYDTERAELSAEFVALADQADRIEAIPASTDAVPDCSTRARFEELLSSLPTLPVRERAELDLLFASCGDYHARLKGFYAERLSSMNNRYRTMRALHDALFASSAEEERVARAMDAIAEGEATRAQDMFSLVSLQRAMNDVYAGRSLRALNEVTDEAHTIGLRFAESDRKIDEARAEITSLFD